MIYHKCSLLIVLIIFIINRPAIAVIGVDLSQYFDDFECMANQGMEFAIMRGYRSYGVVDPNAQQTLLNIR